MHTVPEPTVEYRDQFIPIRKIDLLRALAEGGALPGTEQQEKFRQLCQLLASIFHYEYFAQLERLRDDYYYFNPQLDTKMRFEESVLDAAYADLTDALTKVLKGANFVELSEQAIEEAHRQRPFLRVAVKAPVKDFRDVRFFRRGHHWTRMQMRRWFGLYRKSMDVEVFDDVVLLVAMKPLSAMKQKWELRRMSERGIRPGAVFIKYFRNIRSMDLATLFPNVRVVMGKLDRLMFWIPAVVFGAPTVMKVFSTISVLVIVIGFYLGFWAAIDQMQLSGAVAALGALAALIGFLMTQWVKYERQSLRYQKQITDNVYFNNINNNAGIFDYIIGAAEEQECKEAFLAYYFLLTAEKPLEQEQLDARVEDWLKKNFGFDIDFEVDDAVAKLERLGVLRRDGDKLSVVDIDEALMRLDQRWDNFFTFNRAATA
jgi:Protein of unknown function (DUF3754)